MHFYYAGFNTSNLFSKNGDIAVAIDSFKEVPVSGITDFEIGWSYFLLWKENKLYFHGKVRNNGSSKDMRLIEIPEKSESCKLAAIGKDSVIILSDRDNLWRYKVYEDSWNKVPKFIFANDSNSEYPIKVLQERCTVVLTNLGRVFNVPTLVEMPKKIKFIDIACGFDHTLLLADNGDVYSMGMGTRGQLGHHDLEDCDDPRLIEALAGIKVVEISAGGWHSAVITDQGDLYTWGWNTNGQLGLPDRDSKVLAVPSLIDFKDDRGDDLEISVKKVRCGNAFTICMTDDGTLWGCGSNKYGQLGQSRESILSSSTFKRLDVPFDDPGCIKDYKCHEWGTVLVTD